MNKFLVVGLGNPGNKYLKTRHNIGFDCIDFLSKKFFFELDKQKFNGYYSKIILNDLTIFFAQPHTYMNLSGDFVKKFINFFDIPIENILVIYDDVYIPFASYKLKASGSSGGQKGIQDIITKLNTSNINRIKIGIGQPQNSLQSLSDYVLSKLNSQELEVINNLYSILYNIINDFFSLSFNDLMQKYNGK